jgi:hypothetical protein
MNTIIKSFKGLAVMSAVSLALAGCSEDVMDRIKIRAIQIAWMANLSWPT